MALILGYCFPAFPENEIPENGKESPAIRDETFTVITREDIKSLGVHSIMELLNQVAGVKATETSVSLRGTASKQVVVFLDGRPLNNPLTGSVNLWTVSIHNIEKIEISKGTGSALYGAGTGGIIKITTKRITKRPEGKAEVSYGKFDTQKYDLNYHQKIGEFGCLIAGSFDKSHGYRKNSDSDKKAGTLKLNYRLKEESNLSLSLNYSKKESESPGRIDHPTPNASYNKEEWGTIIDYQRKDWETEIYCSGYDKRTKNPDISLDYLMKSNLLGVDIKNVFDIPYLGDFILGTEVRRSKVDASKIGDHEEDEFALYGEKEFRFGNFPLSLSLGLRGRYHTDYDFALSPQLTISYPLGKGKADFSVNRAATIPTFYERYYKSTFVQGNLNLKEEEATNYNLTVGYRFNESLKGNLSFFFSDIDDLITNQEGKDLVWRYINLKDTSRKGTELETEIDLFEKIKLTVAYTYLIAKNDDTGKYIINRPKHEMNIRLRYSLFDKFTFYLNDRYTSKRFTDHEDTEYLAEYNLLDFEVNYFIKKNKLFFKVDNILGEEYQVHKKYPQPKTTYTLGMTCEF